jgi:hypothetical protein
MFHILSPWFINWCVLSDHYRFHLASVDSDCFYLHSMGSLWSESLQVLLPRSLRPKNLDREDKTDPRRLPFG